MIGMSVAAVRHAVKSPIAVQFLEKFQPRIQMNRRKQIEEEFSLIKDD